MRGVQMADMESSINDLFKEDDDTNSSSSGSQSSDKSEANYTLPDQDNNAPRADEVVININDGEEEDEEDGEDREEERKHDSTSEKKEIKKDSTSEEEEEEYKEESNNDGVEAELIPDPVPEKEPLILHNSGKKKIYIPLRVVLYQAAIKGDWKTAKSIFDADPSAITMKITDADDTPLHIAIFANHISFVEKLVELSSSSDLAIKNCSGDTALLLAASSGVVKIAKLMVDKNPHLPNVYDAMKPSPVLVAVCHKCRDMASFLFSNTNFEALNSSEQIKLLIATISSDYYDIALDILVKKPELANARMGMRSVYGDWRDDECGDTALHVLSRKPSVIGCGSELSFWKRHMNSRFNRIYRKALMETLAYQVVERIWNFLVQNLSRGDLYLFIKTPSRLLLDAAKVGNVELLKILIRSNPDLLWKVNDQDKTIFHVAVENRQERVFSLIYELGGIKNILANYQDRTKNYNMLHLAGMLPSQNHLNRVSGAALQMQRELLWFKEVEKIVIPLYIEMKCADGLTPRELFTKQHRQLQKDGEEWMKNTASSCMLVATLIATIVFAAAFTVPGGNDDKDGVPIFQDNRAFTVFVISDVAALVMSITSILTSLSILTSRYAEEDFLLRLPLKLLFGLVTLFVSIACMAVAFSATFFLVYHKTETKLPLVIAVVTSLPICCFCVLHFKLVVDIVRSSFWSAFSLKKHAGLF